MEFFAFKIPKVALKGLTEYMLKKKVTKTGKSKFKHFVLTHLLEMEETETDKTFYVFYENESPIVKNIGSLSPRVSLKHVPSGTIFETIASAYKYYKTTTQKPWSYGKFRLVYNEFNFIKHG